MSRCRCDDIAECERKIEKLKEASEEMKHYRLPLSTISGQLGELISNVKEAYDAVNMDEFASALAELDSDLKDTRKAFLAEIDSAIDELEDELDDMESEDEDYHEEEEEEDDDDDLLLNTSANNLK